jgi:hypothetical protein
MTWNLARTLLLMASASLLPAAPPRAAERITAPAASAADFPVLPAPGEKVPLGDDHYFTYAFAEPPKLGAAILRVEIFTKAGVRDTSFRVLGDADMPSMRGAHKTGDQPFALNKKGVYLLPIRLVMPGDWEIRLTFQRDGKVLLRGSHLFDL